MQDNYTNDPWANPWRLVCACGYESGTFYGPGTWGRCPKCGGELRYTMGKLDIKWPDQK